MGVKGLWQVLGPVGRPVHFQSLKGKVLAVDVSIWLHQVVKGFRDKDGNPLPNAHLLGVFYRLCKLLHYGIKPVFVFDGGVPILKRQTMMQRKKFKLEALDKAEVSRRKILSNFLKQQLQRNTRQAMPTIEEFDGEEAETGTQSPPKKKSRSASPKKRFGGGPSSSKGADEDTDTFHNALEAFREKFKADEDNTTKLRILEESSDSDEEDSRRFYGMDYSDNFSAIVSNDFDALPLETQHEILFEMQESRKMNSWGKIEQMPLDLKDFSSYQMERLVKRRFLQKKIQTVQQEMGQRHIHVQNLDDLLKMDYDLDDKSQEVIGSREKGCLLVKKKTGSPRKDSLQENSQAETKSCVVDESVPFDVDLSESDEEEVSEMQSSGSSSEDDLRRNGTRSMMATKSKSHLTEEEELSVAIERSLQENNSTNTNSVSNNKSPEKEVVQKAYSVGTVVQDVRPGSSNQVFSNVSQSQLASCSKFLDVIGFSNKISASQSQSQNHSSSSDKIIDISKDDKVEDEDSSSNGSDFEAVEDDASNDFVPELKANQQSSNVTAVISFDEILKPPLEDDFFADVFKEESPADPEVSILGKVSDSVLANSEEKNGEDCDWDSDPDIASMDNDHEVLDSSHKSIKNNVETSPSLGRFNASNSSLSSLRSEHKSDVVSSTTSTSEKTEAKSISRTLGKRHNLSSETRPVKLITAEYMQAQEKLNAEQDKLHSQRGFQERVATSITDQMNLETQELVSLFGIPYLVSPMEAESQCAFLDAACLTEGTITDDSDVWLFGGQRVYKNFYAQGDRHLEFYQLADVTKVLNLEREKLVLVAMVSGGDYSEGIEGCGPVSALEILAEFPTNSIDAFDVLVQFREWWDLAQLQQSPLDSKIREKLRKFKLKPGFPNRAVYDAYMDPTIDTSTEPFRWGTPDLDAIRTYTKTKFGWDQAKCDGLLLPAIKNFRCQAEQAKQQTLDKFVVHGFKPSLDAKIKRKTGSKRLNVALKKLKKVFPDPGNLQLSSSSSSDSNSETDDADTIKEELVVNPVPSTPCVVEQSSSSQSSSSSKFAIRRSSQPETIENSLEDKTSRASKTTLHNKEVRIPQKIQEDTKRKQDKQKAIEIFKSKKF